LYVSKPNSTAFIEPTVPKIKLDDTYYQELKNSRYTLSEWITKFAIMNKIEDKKATTDKIGIEKFYVVEAIKHQTPLRTGQAAKDNLNYFDLTPYKRQINDSTTTIKLENNVAVPMDLLGVMDDGIYETSSNLLRLIASHDSYVDDLVTVITKVDGLQNMLGNRSDNMEEDFQAPTLWGTVALLATFISKVHNTCTHMEPKIMGLITDITRLQSNTKNFLVQEDAQVMNSRVDGLRDTVLQLCESVQINTKRTHQSIESLGLEIDEVRNVRARITPSTSTSMQVSSLPLDIKEEFESICKTNDELKILFKNLSAQADKEAIKFCNLGFRTYQDAGAWIDIHFPDYSFGLIMSPFTVLEHIHSIFSGLPSLDKLTQLYKLKIDNLNKGLAMTSFDSWWPKYFMKTQSVSPITIDQSFFDKIPTYEVWDENQTGFRDRLKEELVTFQQGYHRMITNDLSPGDQAYTIAYHSVTASVSFLEGLICFIDDIYKELHRAKFSKTKAWALVTRLLRRIFMDIGAPRISVQNQFRTGQDDIICKQIFWAEIQTIEIMDQFKRQSFKDHPAIASEYVKFLVTNTGIESLERMIKRVDVVEEQMKELQKQVKAATTAATTAANKADEVKKLNTDLLRRITALEKGK
jgi:uncharacterized protein YoxC